MSTSRVSGTRSRSSDAVVDLPAVEAGPANPMRPCPGRPASCSS